MNLKCSKRALKHCFHSMAMYKNTVRQTVLLIFAAFKNKQRTQLALLCCCLRAHHCTVRYRKHHYRKRSAEHHGDFRTVATRSPRLCEYQNSNLRIKAKVPLKQLQYPALQQHRNLCFSSHHLLLTGLCVCYKYHNAPEWSFKRGGMRTYETLQNFPKGTAACCRFLLRKTLTSKGTLI